MVKQTKCSFNGQRTESEGSERQMRRPYTQGTTRDPAREPSSATAQPAHHPGPRTRSSGGPSASARAARHLAP